MKVIFSRKGFDSAAGGCPSPIVDGRAKSLPIPAVGDPRRPWIKVKTRTRYCDLGLETFLSKAGSSKVFPEDLCHHDPMFHDGWCWFGQCDAAQSHLINQRVCEGDIFLFFGLFKCPETGERHHRIFGYLEVAGSGSPNVVIDTPQWRTPRWEHPHFIEEFPENNCLWFGPGQADARAIPTLRLTAPDAQNRSSHWLVPAWLRECGLSYHDADWRWGAVEAKSGSIALRSVGRGQEFVCDIGDRADAYDWVRARVTEITDN